ncbi:MAG: hypothetical protein V7750_18170, partial [Sneathiella sp.]
SVSDVDGTLEPEELADCVIETMDREDFLMLPHPQVLTYIQHKASDYNRWIKGMQRLRDRFLG